jgi:hypothetical protein
MPKINFMNISKVFTLEKFKEELEWISARELRGSMTNSVLLRTYSVPDDCQEFYEWVCTKQTLDLVDERYYTIKSLEELIEMKARLV